jgi:taurine dioxygenase
MPIAQLAEISNQSAAGLQIQPLSIHTGARIDGVDLKQPLPVAQRDAIEAALRRWKVVFFHDQHLDHAEHVAFSRQFGELTIGHPVFGYVEGHPEVYSVGRDRFQQRFSQERLVRPWSGWHTDVTAAVNPPAASILRGVEIPSYGGDTQWTNLVAAYNGLSPTLRGFVDTLRGEHRFTPPEGSVARQDFLDPLAATPLVSEHPLVRVHPYTGEKALFVSPGFLKRIVGLSLRESEQLLHLLFEHAIRPEYTVRFKWQPGAIAFWDNRATAHLPPEDIYASDFPRQLYRTTLVGDVPVGVDGQPSRAVEGKPVLAHSRE